MLFEEQDDTLLCRFGDELNSETCETLAPRLAERIDRVLGTNPEANIVFDLRDTRYATSAFLRLCVLHCKRVGEKRFQVLNLNENVKRIFSTSGLLEIMAYRSSGNRFDMTVD